MVSILSSEEQKNSQQALMAEKEMAEALRQSRKDFAEGNYYESREDLMKAVEAERSARSVVR